MLFLAGLQLLKELGPYDRPGFFVDTSVNVVKPYVHPINANEKPIFTFALVTKAPIGITTEVAPIYVNFSLNNYASFLKKRINNFFQAYSDLFHEPPVIRRITLDGYSGFFEIFCELLNGFRGKVYFIWTFQYMSKIVTTRPPTLFQRCRQHFTSNIENHFLLNVTTNKTPMPLRKPLACLSKSVFNSIRLAKTFNIIMKTINAYKWLLCTKQLCLKQTITVTSINWWDLLDMTVDDTSRSNLTETDNDNNTENNNTNDNSNNDNNTNETNDSRKLEPMSDFQLKWDIDIDTNVATLNFFSDLDIVFVIALAGTQISFCIHPYKNTTIYAPIDSTVSIKDINEIGNVYYYVPGWHYMYPWVFKKIGLVSPLVLGENEIDTNQTIESFFKVAKVCIDC